MRSEYVLQVTGKVRARDAATVNPNMPTGDVEVYGTELTILNSAETPPFPLNEHSTVGEDVRLKIPLFGFASPRNAKQLAYSFKSNKQLFVII